MPVPIELIDRRVQVVAGKGGVGRSVIASALALRASRAGFRTLLLEVNAPDNCARYLECSPAPDAPREVLNNLWLCRMTPNGALREYALMVLKFKSLYNFVFENPVVKYFLRSIPSLGEFSMMGKAWYHSTEKLASGKPRYERIIIDAPATGHAITLLSVSRVVADTVPKGIMKNAAEDMAALLEQHEQACLHTVALPEEMPVNEAIHLAEAAHGQLRMSTGVAVMNRILSPLLDGAQTEALAKVDRDCADAAGLAPYLGAARRRLDWEHWQRECIDQFDARIGSPVIRIPELGNGAIDREAISHIADLIDAAVGPADRQGEATDG